ncbi:hypothetical protein [Paraburkholderia metrosideri]|nr:hypothetical protein [Paraburkholderia metrosideri]
MSGVLRFLVEHGSSNMRCDQDPARKCYILKVTGRQNFDLRLRMVLADRRFSETRFVAIDSPDDHSQCLFSTAAQIARLAARGVIVVCAVDLSHESAKTLKFAIETLGIKLREIHLKSSAESQDFTTQIAKRDCENITWRHNAAVALHPASFSPTPVVRGLMRYLAARNRIGIPRRVHVDNVLDAKVDAFTVVHWWIKVVQSLQRIGVDCPDGSAATSRRVEHAVTYKARDCAIRTTVHREDFLVNRVLRERRWR